jgi:hypothetical protein
MGQGNTKTVDRLHRRDRPFFLATVSNSPSGRKPSLFIYHGIIQGTPAGV